MNKILALLFTFLPALVCAQPGSLSFTPPASDFSVVFLANLFGIVDGVLHGTGSQIMGGMFTVFNSAVLALGGIVIMYTLLVSTMNTAHEGQMLGQKWSSIWIPVRATMGLALLIPKASGYCLMQIFVMWVVVQGVGAADKVWNAALDYLNRGGAIIQSQMNPTDSMLSTGAADVALGAQTILAGQVCMLGLQTQLQMQLQTYQAEAQNKSGPCAGNGSDAMKVFCNSTVPNFIDSVNAVNIQNLNPNSTSEYQVTMPNFDATSPYSYLNGICGTIKWNPFSAAALASIQANITTLSATDLQTASMSRSIAIQQMYMDLSSVAQSLVGNNPLLGPIPSNPPANPNNLPPFASQQLGFPLMQDGSVCPNNTTPATCILWGGVASWGGGALLNGTEFQGALQDYNGVMLPTLNLVAQANNSVSANASRSFIADASTQGWIMAGSYFFNLVNINVQASANNGAFLHDSNTGLADSTINLANITSAFATGSSKCISSDPYALLCTWFNGNSSRVSPIRELIDGTGAVTSIVPSTFSTTQPRNTVQGVGSLTVYGYTNNSTIIQLPGQPGFQPPVITPMGNITINWSQFDLPPINFSCGTVHYFGGSPCVGGLIGDIFYNQIFRWMFNSFLDWIGNLIIPILDAFLIFPLQGMATIFTKGMAIIDTPGANPVVALANMGTYYINFAGNLWIFLLKLNLTASLIPIFGAFVFAIIAMAMPIFMAWMGIMLQIGMSTAYYVPILPYMIFTFGSIAWLMAVIEAMVAAPIVALGVTHPEGHDAFGKGEQAVMILMNVFLRPSMMIIGYIASIALTYVSVWIINAGFTNAIGFMNGTILGFGSVTGPGIPSVVTGGYTSWAGIYAYFFAILVYTTMYLVVVQKSFTLIAVLPDKVLRWIGGSPESAGQDAAQWGQEVQSKLGEAGKDTTSGQAQMDKQALAAATKGIGAVKDGMGALNKPAPEIGAS
jgi:defect-in-organelle-trafficking protein DotA